MHCDQAPGLPTLCLKKVWKLREVLNMRGATGHRSAQAQEVFWSGLTEIHLQSRVKILEF